jgi:hypothetical protein
LLEVARVDRADVERLTVVDDRELAVVEEQLADATFTVLCAESMSDGPRPALRGATLPETVLVPLTVMLPSTERDSRRR